MNLYKTSRIQIRYRIMKELSIILFFLAFQSALAAIPNCPTGAKCGPNGIWGEWTTVGDENCPLECGGCGELIQTKECLSNEIPGCSCIGSASRSIPCNMKSCPYPTQRACCIPYLPMIVNGNSTCGPLPKTMRESATSCCPIGGLWSEWSPGYTRLNSQWVRTRRCLSASIGCPCTGNENEGSTNCPCAQPPVASSECPTVQRGRSFIFRNLIIRHDTYGYRYYAYVPLLILKEIDGDCVADYPFYCANDKTVGLYTNVSFTCDTNTKYWTYDYSGKQIKSYTIGVFY
uniref:ShKT domain-containing protein n=2 Tax=Caenorhabditis tropicalis TaxID=1561998 RepID=A0A1I7T5A6_9PELO